MLLPLKRRAAAAHLRVGRQQAARSRSPIASIAGRSRLDFVLDVPGCLRPAWQRVVRRGLDDVG